MDNLLRRINLFHYNIWRFERWTRYLVFGDSRVTTIATNGHDGLEDSVPLAVRQVDKSMLPNYSGKHFALLLFLFLFTALNFVGAAFDLNLETFWFWGMAAALVVSSLLSLYWAPVERSVLYEDFTKFDLMSESDKRISALITFLFVIGIWAISIVSFVYYLRSLMISR